MPKYTVSKVIEALRIHHGLLVFAADELGCSRQTLYNYAERYPAVAEVLAEERERRIDVAEQGLDYHLEQKSPWAIALVLKTLGRPRGYGDRPWPGAPPHTKDDLSEWPQIQYTLLQALEDYPEARLAVVDALKAMESHVSTNGSHPST